MSTFNHNQEVQSGDAPQVTWYDIYKDCKILYDNSNVESSAGRHDNAIAYARTALEMIEPFMQESRAVPVHYLSDRQRAIKILYFAASSQLGYQQMKMYLSATICKNRMRQALSALEKLDPYSQYCREAERRLAEVESTNYDPNKSLAPAIIVKEEQTNATQPVRRTAKKTAPPPTSSAPSGAGTDRAGVGATFDETLDDALRNAGI